MAELEFVFQSVTIDKVALDNYLNNPENDVGKYLKRKGRLIIAAAKQQVGVDSGALRDSIHFTHFRDSRGQYLWLGSNKSYAYLHHEGTRPHAIIPREAPILRFTAGARVIYTRHVNHPGTKPNRYLSDQLYLIKV